MKRMMLISMFILILVTSCKDDTTSPVIKPLNTDELIPLKNGNTWEYRETEYDPLGFIIKSFQNSIWIIKDSIYHGETVYIWGIGTIKHHPTGFLTLVRDDGYYFVDINNEDSVPRMYFKFPTFKGDSFIYYEDTVKIEDVDVEYTVPAGKFKCIKYVEEVSWDNEIQMKTISYYSPGIGHIATEYYDRLNHDYLWLSRKTVLMSYKFK